MASYSKQLYLFKCIVFKCLFNFFWSCGRKVNCNCEGEEVFNLMCCESYNRLLTLCGVDGQVDSVH